MRQTIKLKPAPLKLLNTVADLWKPAQDQELMERGPSQHRSLRGKGEKLQLRVGHGVSQTGRKRPKKRDDVEVALLATANSLVQEAKKTPEPQKAEPECEYSYSCKSLRPRPKKLSPRTRAVVRMSIEQVLFQAEFPSTPSHPMQMRASGAVPMHHGYHYQSQGNYRQSQGNGQEPQQHLHFNVNREQQKDLLQYPDMTRFYITPRGVDGLYLESR